MQHPNKLRRPKWSARSAVDCSHSTVPRLVLNLVLGAFLAACCPPQKPSAAAKAPPPADTASIASSITDLHQPSPAVLHSGTRPHKVSDGEDAEKYRDTFEWSQKSPVEFLELLKQKARKTPAGIRPLAYVVIGKHHDWIQDSDVEPLVKLLDSETPCVHVRMAISAGSLTGLTTEGHEAAFLLEGYRKRFYPPELYSTRFKPDKSELRHWYRIWSTRGDEPPETVLVTGTRPHKVSDGPDAKEIWDTFEWSRHSPVEFLDVLKEWGKKGAAKPPYYIVVGLHHDWIQDSDVEELMKRLDSDTPCAHVIMEVSSSLPKGLSTEGHQAAFLIEGYRKRFYPPELSSGRLEVDKQKLLHWFEIWRTRR